MPATNIIEEHHPAFEALTSGRYDNFALFSCEVDNHPAAPIVVVNQTGRTRPGLGRVACGRASDGLKDADIEMGPTSGTLHPQQAGSRDGSGAPSPTNLQDKSWVCAQARL